MVNPLTMQRLQAQIDAVAPTVGVAVNQGTVTRIDFLPTATQAQQDAAWAVARTFDWSAAADAAFTDAQEPLLSDLRDQLTGALAAIDSYLTIADTATAAQVRAEVKAIDQRQRRILRALARVVERTWR